MPTKRSTTEKALSSVLSDIENLDLSDYSNDRDFELETDHSSGESDNSDHDTPFVRNVLPATFLQLRRGRKRGAGICILRIWIFLQAGKRKQVVLSLNSSLHIMPQVLKTFLLTKMLRVHL